MGLSDYDATPITETGVLPPVPLALSNARAAMSAERPGSSTRVDSVPSSPAPEPDRPASSHSLPRAESQTGADAEPGTPVRADTPHSDEQARAPNLPRRSSLAAEMLAQDAELATSLHMMSQPADVTADAADNGSSTPLASSSPRQPAVVPVSASAVEAPVSAPTSATLSLADVGGETTVVPEEEPEHIAPSTPKRDAASPEPQPITLVVTVEEAPPSDQLPPPAEDTPVFAFTTEPIPSEVITITPIAKPAAVHAQAEVADAVTAPVTSGAGASAGSSKDKDGAKPYAVIRKSTRDLIEELRSQLVLDGEAVPPASHEELSAVEESRVSLDHTPRKSPPASGAPGSADGSARASSAKNVEEDTVGSLVTFSIPAMRRRPSLDGARAQSTLSLMMSDQDPLEARAPEPQHAASAPSSKPTSSNLAGAAADNTLVDVDQLEQEAAAALAEHEASHQAHEHAVAADDEQENTVPAVGVAVAPTASSSVAGPYDPHLDKPELSITAPRDAPLKDSAVKAAVALGNDLGTVDPTTQPPREDDRCCAPYSQACAIL